MDIIDAKREQDDLLVLLADQDQKIFSLLIILITFSGLYLTTLVKLKADTQAVASLL